MPELLRGGNDLAALAEDLAAQTHQDHFGFPVPGIRIGFAVPPRIEQIFDGAPGLLERPARPVYDEVDAVWADDGAEWMGSRMGRRRECGMGREFARCT